MQSYYVHLLQLKKLCTQIYILTAVRQMVHEPRTSQQLEAQIRTYQSETHI